MKRNAERVGKMELALRKAVRQRIEETGNAGVVGRVVIKAQAEKQAYVQPLRRQA